MDEEKIEELAEKIIEHGKAEVEGKFTLRDNRRLRKKVKELKGEI